MRSVLAIVVAYRSADVIDELLESLATESATSLRSVIVDNSSDDETAEKVKRAAKRLNMEIEYVPYMNVGYAGGINRGLQHLLDEDDAVLVLNPDLTIGPGSLQVLCDALTADPGVAVAIPCYLDGTGRRVAFWTNLPRPRDYWKWALDLRRARRASLSNATRNVEWGPGACLFVRAEALRAVPRPDEGIFLYMEDADWCRRFLEAGWSVRFVPSATVVHQWGHAGNADLRRRVFLTHISKLYYFEKWYGRRGLLLATAQMVVESAAKSITLFAVCRSGQAKGYWDLLRSIPIVLSVGPLTVQDRFLSRIPHDSR